MRLVILSNAPLIKKQEDYFAYSPYVKEIEYWMKHSDETVFVCAVLPEYKNLLIEKINSKIADVVPLKDFNLTTLKKSFFAFFYSFYNCFIIYKAFKKADHIHLRCPGNIGLLGCLVQILFPKKIKTAKYAGNWAPNSNQPLTYRIQKWILNNTFLTKNMKVLVYGEWDGSSKNIKPFFTATYKEIDKSNVVPRDFSNAIKFLFIGTLSPGKRPLYAIQLIENIRKSGYKVALDLYGEGSERLDLENYIKNNSLENYINLKGNHPQETIKKELQENHFVVLPSKSEGWPKVIAEGMFWGCLPISTAISCVPNMLNGEERGLLLSLDIEKDTEKIIQLLSNENHYQKISLKAMEWSRKYTLDYFENEIKKLLQDENNSNH